MELFFSASYVKLYESDGTDAGTHQVLPNIGTFSSFDLLTNFNGELYFRATDGNGVIGLWKSDGSKAGTVQVLAISAPHSVYATLHNLTVVGNHLMFTARNAATGTFDLLETDGTAAGTQTLTGPDVIGSAIDFVALGDQAFFRAADPISGDYGLWESNAAGTAFQQVIPSTGAFRNVSDLVAANGEIYFAAHDVGMSSYSLWKTDGTPGGTTKIYSVHASNITAADGQVFFTDASNTNNNLFVTDGSPGGTHEIPLPGQGGILVTAGRFVFDDLINSSNHQPELWASDGTPSGTHKISGDFLQVVRTAAVGNELFFIALDPIHGFGLWKTEGSSTAAQFIASTGITDVSTTLVGIDGKLYFSGYDGTHGFETWVSDGTAEGTHIVSDVTPGVTPNTNIPYQGATLGSALIFSQYDPFKGLMELWASDGTVGGTHIIQMADLLEVTGPVVAINGEAYFPTYDLTTNKGGIWQTDGTSAGTGPASATVNSNFSPPEAMSVSVGGETVFIKVNYSTSKEELWVTDSSPAGSHKLEPVTGGFTDIARGLLVLGNKVAFDGFDATLGWQEWITDGTAAGTLRLTSAAVPRSAYPVGFVGLAPAPGTTSFILDPTTDSGLAGDSLTNFADPRLSGWAPKDPSASIYGSLVYIYENGVLLANPSEDPETGYFSGVLPHALADGTHLLTVSTTPGGPAFATLSLTIDTQSPTVSLRAQPGVVSGGLSNVRLVGAVSDGSVTVYQDGASLGAATLDGLGNWSLTSHGVSDAVHVFQARATDAAGNPGSSGLFYLGSSHGDVITGDNGGATLFGQGGDDQLTGGTGHDGLFGGAGNDSLIGGGGIDYLDGGAGADVLNGAGGIATAYYQDSPTGLTINLLNPALNTGDGAGDSYVDIHRVEGSAFGDTLVADNAGDYLYGDGGSDILTGGTGADHLYGGPGDDVINGGAGNDLIVGGTGADVLTGGLGSDIFVFAAPTDGVKTITDFSEAQADELQFLRSGFGAGLTAGFVDAAHFVAGAAATAANGQFLWDAATHHLSWDADGTGAGAPILLAALSGVSTLVAHDLYLF